MTPAWLVFVPIVSIVEEFIMPSTSQPNTPSLVSIITTVLWGSSVLVGLLGLYLPYPRPPIPDKEPSAVQAEIVQVDLQTTPPAEAPPFRAQSAPLLDLSAPAPPPVAAPPEAPPMAAVAAASPAIAFALPVEGLIKLVDASNAGFSRPAHSPPTNPTATGSTGPGNAAAKQKALALPAVAPPVTHLTLGEGEGDQPLPDYPHDAITQRQEGAVGVRLTVAEDGRVTSASVIAPCRWPLLNQSALRAVRQHWRFQPGLQRQYDVSIEFQLHH
jgi:TonB family protein